MKSRAHRNSSAVALVAALATGGIALAQSGIGGQKSGNGQEHRKIVLTSPRALDIDITQRYACRIHSRRHINVCALLNGRLEEIKIKEGQAVKQGDLMFKIAPALGEADPNAAFANVKAPFDGLVGRLHEEPGSPIKEGDVLTTLSDNVVMWVYFTAPLSSSFAL
jgi:membrane fusion protein, multidrug efflux system